MQTTNVHADFLRAELALCLTFCNVAETNFHIGHRLSAEEAVNNAELGSATLTRFLSKELHLSQLSHEELEQIRAGHQHLRDRLDELQRFRI